MVQIILGCIIGNTVTLAAIGGVGYYLYTKNKDKITAIKSDIDKVVSEVNNGISDVAEIAKKANEAMDEIKPMINDVKETVNAVKPAIDELKETINGISTTISDIKKALEKLPFM